MKRRNILLSFAAAALMITIMACGAIGATATAPVISLATPVSSVESGPTASGPIAIGPTQAGTGTPNATPGAVVPVTGGPGELIAAYEGTLEQIYTSVGPSVVNIEVLQQGTASDGSQGVQGALGSGFVWDTNGYIVTNNHVIAGADTIQVTFSDGMIVPAKLVGADPDSDLAVIKVDVAADKLHPVQMGDSNAVKVGQLAIAIGEPFGLQGTMTTGIISAIGRSLPANEGATQSYSIPDIIQTDAPINPGNSGGVLVDVNGQVIGVTSAIESPVRASAGIGFAIPANIVKNVVPALIQNGKYEHSWLGISGASLIPDLAKAMNLDPAQRGALVEKVTPGGPADKAGIRGSDKQITINGVPVLVGGDVIIGIDNQPVQTMDDVIAYLARNTKVGQKITLNLVRNGKEVDVDLTLEARPATQQSATNPPQQGGTAGITLGIKGTTVDDAIANAMNLPAGTQGVLIEQIQPGSMADQAGLQAGNKSITLNGQQVKIGGDIITAVEGQPVASIDDLKGILAQLPSDHQLTLTIIRDGQETQVTIQPGGQSGG